jgi:hypothetical protein
MSRRRRIRIDLADIGREGRRWYAFYRGYRAAREGKASNPHEAGSEPHACWAAGRAYAEQEQRETSPPPVCRFGPGGDFVRDLREGDL